MKIKTNVDIKDLDTLLILEINERVNDIVTSINNEEDVESINLEILKIDRESLNNLKGYASFETVAPNLIEKIDHILASFTLVED